MIKCVRCTANLTEKEAGDTTRIASLQAAGHPFLCNRCIDSVIKGESVTCGDHLEKISECGCKL